MVAVRWYFAEEGVRRSKMRRCESEDTAEIRAGLDGQNAALYVQLPMGRVLRENSRVGDHLIPNVSYIPGKSRTVLGEPYQLDRAIP